MMLRLSGAIAALALAVIVAAPAGAAVIEVTIDHLAFAPATVRAQAGDTIEWVNKDFVAHTATARDKSFDVTIPADGKGHLTVTAAGAVDYYCRFHPMMKGRIETGAN